MVTLFQQFLLAMLVTKLFSSKLQDEWYMKYSNSLLVIVHSVNKFILTCFFFSNIYHYIICWLTHHVCMLHHNQGITQGCQNTTYNIMEFVTIEKKKKMTKMGKSDHEAVQLINFDWLRTGIFCFYFLKILKMS